MAFEAPPGAKPNWNGRIRASIEHLIDRKYGGTRTNCNMVLAHSGCNSEREGMELAAKISRRCADAPPIPERIQVTLTRPAHVLARMRRWRAESGNDFSYHDPEMTT